MPAVSKSQQRLMGMVHAYKQGDLETKDLPAGLVKKIKGIADGQRKKTGDKRKKSRGMSDKDAKDFASTKHKGLPEKVEESNGISLNQEIRKDYIDFIMDSTMDDRKDLERLSDDNLEERYYEIVDFLSPHPIDPRAHLEELIPEDDQENERFITKFDNFINESKKPKGEKLKFEDWWKKTYEKKADYWVEKKEIKQGYQSNELSHYYEKKIRAKYNKYLKKRKK